MRSSVQDAVSVVTGGDIGVHDRPAGQKNKFVVTKRKPISSRLHPMMSLFEDILAEVFDLEDPEVKALDGKFDSGSSSWATSEADGGWTSIPLGQNEYVNEGCRRYRVTESPYLKGMRADARPLPLQELEILEAMVRYRGSVLVRYLLAWRDDQERYRELRRNIPKLIKLSRPSYGRRRKVRAR